MKNIDENTISSKKPTNLTNKKNRVFARQLSRQLTHEESNKVSGGSGSENGRWYWTDSKKVQGYDWAPN